MLQTELTEFTGGTGKHRHRTNGSTSAEAVELDNAEYDDEPRVLCALLHPHTARLGVADPFSAPLCSPCVCTTSVGGVSSTAAV